MPTFLFDDIIFGPVSSRRLGKSLGINLLPTHRKICNFDCIYCECGLSPHELIQKSHFPSASDVKNALTAKLVHMKAQNDLPTTITFAGNGEPTLHPEFEAIILSTVEIRNRLAPQSKIAVLSNATLISRKTITSSLAKIDLNILKLDSALNNTINCINRPKLPFSADKLIDNLQEFRKKIIIQTLFLKGTVNGQYIDNTSPEELNALLDAYQLIKPEMVMIYTIARSTPVEGLEKIEKEQLDAIGQTIEKLGIKVQISY